MENDMQTITPKLAREYIDKAKIDDSIMRPIREPWVNVLADRMKNGQFAPSATIALAHLNGSTYIVNGNHTLRAIERSGVVQKLPIIHHAPATLSEVKQLYATYDRGLSRKVSDSLRAYGAMSDFDMNMQEVNQLSAAVRFMLNDFDQTTARAYSVRYISDDVLMSYMRPWAEEYNAIRSHFAGYKKEDQRLVLTRRVVLSVALITVRGQGEHALDFWTKVITGANLDTFDGAKRLRDYLMVNGMRGGAAKKKSESPVRYFKTVTHCWNRWFTGEPISVLRVPEGRVTFNGCEHVELPRLPEG